MTDETRPGSGTPGNDEQEDALATWFRPQPEAEAEKQSKRPSAEADSGSDEGAQAEDSGESLTQAVRAAFDHDRTQVIPARPAVKPVEKTPVEAKPAEKKPAENEPSASLAVESPSGADSANDQTQVIPAPPAKLPTAETATNKPSADKAPAAEQPAAEPTSAKPVDPQAATVSTDSKAPTGSKAPADSADSKDSADSANAQTQLIPAPPAKSPVGKSPVEKSPAAEPATWSAPADSKPTDSANDQTQLMPKTPPVSATRPLPPPPPPSPVGPTRPLPTPPIGPASGTSASDRPASNNPAPNYAASNYAAAAPTQAIPRTPPPAPSMAVRGSTPPGSQTYGAGQNWGAGVPPQQPPQRPQYNAAGPGAGQPPILPIRSYHDDDDDFDRYDYADGGGRRGGRRRALLVTAGLGLLVIAVAAALVLTGTVKVAGLSAKPIPTVGFSPSGADAGSNATQTGGAFLTDWQNGNLKAAANITDNPADALTELTAYKTGLKLSGLTLLPGTATAAGWMTFNVTAQVGSPASAWSYSSGLAAYSASVDGYTRWFVKWQPSVLFTTLKSGQKLGLGTIAATASKVVDRNGTQITSSNAPSLTGIVKALEQNAPTTDGTPGQVVQIETAAGTLVSKVAKVSDPVNTGAVKTTIDLNIQAAAQSAVGQASNSSMVVIQPSTGDILAVVNNPSGGLDNAMVGKYAPGSTFKTISTTLALNKGVITNLNQTWDCPLTYAADGITLHNSEQESGVGKSFVWDFAQSCNNAFSRFNTHITRNDLVATAHDYYGFNQTWDVGLGIPTVYGNVPNTSSNSLAEELVGQDRIAANPLAMASVAATIANCSFKQPILVPGTAQISATALSASTCANLKTLMRAVVTSGTLATVFNGASGVYGKTGTAEVGSAKANSWTIAFKGDYAVAALALHGGFGASTAGPEVKTLLNAIS